MTRKIKLHEEDAKSLLIIAFTDAFDNCDGITPYLEYIVDLFESIYPQLSQNLQGFTVDTLKICLRQYFEKKEKEDAFPSSTAYWKRFYARLEKLRSEIPYNNPDLVRGAIK